MVHEKPWEVENSGKPADDSNEVESFNVEHLDTVMRQLGIMARYARRREGLLADNGLLSQRGVFADVMPVQHTDNWTYRLIRCSPDAKDFSSHVV